MSGFGGFALLHGFGGSRESWAEVGPHLGAPTRALALLGHEFLSDGAAPAGRRSFEQEVDRLARELRFWTDRPLHLVGYSLGGRLGLGLLMRHRALFCRATLIGVHAGLEDDAAREERSQRDESWARRLEEEGLQRFFEAWESQPLFAGQARLPAPVQERQRRLRRRLDAAGLAMAMRHLGLARMPSYWSELGDLGLPVDLVVGAEDAKFVDLARRLVALLPDGRLRIVPGVGHNVLLEAPEELVAILSSPPEGRS